MNGRERREVKQAKARKIRRIAQLLVATLVLVAVSALGFAWYNSQVDYDNAFKGYSTPKVERGDPVVHLVEGLVESYSVWLEGHPRDTASDDALKAFIRLHNDFAKHLSGDLAVPEIKDIKDLENGKTYAERMRPVTDHLQSLGWYASFQAPVVIHAQDGSERRAGYVCIGPVYRRLKGKVVTTEGTQEVDYIEDIVRDVTQVDTGNFLFTSITTSTHIVHFLQPLIEQVNHAVDVCEAGVGSDQDWRMLPQWGGDYRWYRGRAFRAKVFREMFSCAHAHELQHVRDFHLCGEANQLKWSEEAVNKLAMVTESRGLNRAVADGLAPIYALGHIESWANGNVPSHKAAGFVAANGLKDVVLAESGYSRPEFARLLTKQAKKNQAEYDRIYRSVMRNIAKPDPVGAAMSELSKEKQ